MPPRRHGMPTLPALLPASPVALLALVLLAAGLFFGPSAGLFFGPSSAHAETAVFEDRRGDTASPADVVRVTVGHGDVVVVRIRHRDLSFELGQAPRSVRVAYGVPGGSVGPDFVLRVPYQADPVPQLRPVQGWDSPGGPPVVGCTGERVRVSSERDVTRVTVPRACFGNPTTIRVHVRVTVHAADIGRADVAPGVRAMTTAVGYTTPTSVPAPTTTVTPRPAPTVTPTPTLSPQPKLPVPSPSVPPPVPGPTGGPEPV